MYDLPDMTSRRVFISASGVLVVAVMTWFARLRVNLSGSMPIGFYRVSAGPPVRGSMVLACLPTTVAGFARSRAYVPSGSCAGGTSPIGKVVLAMAGDSVQVTHTGLIVNGRPVHDTKPLDVDGVGRALPRLQDGVYVVAADELWLYSPYSERSYDSRYFGPLPLSSILNRVLPLLTFE